LLLLLPQQRAIAAIATAKGHCCYCHGKGGRRQTVIATVKEHCCCHRDSKGPWVLLLPQQWSIAHFQRLQQWAHHCGTWAARSHRELSRPGTATIEDR
jgi:hypothetical protein